MGLSLIALGGVRSRKGGGQAGQSPSLATPKLQKEEK